MVAVWFGAMLTHTVTLLRLQCEGGHRSTWWSRAPSYLEVENPSVAKAKALVLRDHSGQCFLIKSEGGDGCQQPAVPCRVKASIKPAIANSQRCHRGCGDSNEEAGSFPRF
jgi:hypothetical protein